MINAIQRHRSSKKGPGQEPESEPEHAKAGVVYPTSTIILMIAIVCDVGNDRPWAVMSYSKRKLT